MKIVVVYLVGGQTVVGKKRDRMDHKLELEDPYEVMVAPTGNGQVQVGWMGYGSCLGYLSRLQSVTLEKEHYIDFVEAPKRVEDGYLQASSKILLGGT